MFVSSKYYSSGSEWLWVTPWSLRKMLNWITDTYNRPRILITENGVSDRNATLADEHRVFYYRQYINNALKGKYVQMNFESVFVKFKLQNQQNRVLGNSMSRH